MLALVTVIPPKSWKEDGQGILFALIVSELVYPLIWWDQFWIYGGFNGRSPKIKKVLFGAFFCDIHHPIGGIDSPVWEIFVTHDECVGRWTPPPHHPKILPYKHQPLHPLPLPFVWPLVPDEGVGVQHPGGCWGFGPMAGSEAHGSWYYVSSIFAIFAILRSMEWPAPYYQNSLVFMNETGKKISQVPLLMKNMMWERQYLVYMFNIRHGCFCNQLLSC